jgi:hypothetical protein
MITISGTAEQVSTSGSAAASGVAIAAYQSSAPTTVIAMTTSDGSGNYSLTIPTGGSALDGFLKATMSGNVDTYLYTPGPIASDFTGVPIEELNTSTYNLLAQTLGGGKATQGTIALEVLQSLSLTSTPIAGATVSSVPAATKTGYTSGALPSTTATATAADGRAYLFGLDPGSVTVSVTKTGDTFPSVTVGVFAESLTTTFIPE